MDLDGIRKEVAKDFTDTAYFRKILKDQGAFDLSIGGTVGVEVPIVAADAFEAFCDDQRIPCHRVALSDGLVYFSIADTYATLLVQESQR